MNKREYKKDANKNLWNNINLKRKRKVYHKKTVDS